MDIQKFIASGILEQYVLGSLSRAEHQEVEQYAVQYPEIRKEIDAIEHAFEVYANAHAVPPSPGLEADILKKIETRQPFLRKDKNNLRNSGSTSYKTFYRVAIAAFLAAIVWAIFLNNKLSEKENEIANLQEQYDQLNSTCTEQLKEKERTEQLFAFLKDRNTNSVELKGLPEKDPSNIAVVYQNNQMQKSYLEVISMPAVPSNKQYQLWAIVNGTPVDMGVFDVVLTPSTPFIEVPYIADAQAFAVTVEKPGGNPTPTLEEMVVIGNAG